MMASVWGRSNPAGQTHPAAFLGQQTGVGHAVGHISGIQCRAADGPGQRQRGGTCVQIDEILCRDEGRRRIGDGPLFGHGQALLGSHGGLVGSELAAWQRGTAVDFIDFAQTVQLVQIPADGGLAGILDNQIHSWRSLADDGNIMILVA